MDHDRLLAETLARHFEGATLGEHGIELGWKGVRLQSRVDATHEMGSTRSVSLFMSLVGGPIDPGVFISVSGYGASVEEAIVSGACNWATTFGPVLRSALTGESFADVPEFEVVHQGQRLRVVLDGLDRGLEFAGETPDVEALRQRREELAASGWMLQTIFNSDQVPVLRGDRPTVLSAFLGDGNGKRIVEFKVDGIDWPAERAFAAVPVGQEPRMAFLRELALAVPMEPAPKLTRAAVEATLRGLQAELHGARRVVAWPGWAAHHGRLGPPLDPKELQRLEGSIGRLPLAYRDFVTDVAASGAGPGYGLLPPNAASQRLLADGEFAWKDGVAPSDRPRGVLALAHAGCGVMWLLVLNGEHAGEVWVDAGGSDGLARRVAPDFQSWYRTWLHSCVRDELNFVQWDSDCCATASVLSQVFSDYEKNKGLKGQELRDEVARSLGAGAMGISSTGGPYFNPGDAVSPCSGCVDLAAGIGLGVEVFNLGQPPIQGRGDSIDSLASAHASEPAKKKGFWTRLFG